MPVPNLKEDLELIAALTAGTTGYIKNHVSKMIVGDGKFLKNEVEPRSVIEKAKADLIKENAPQLQARLAQQATSQPPQQQIQQPPVLPPAQQLQQTEFPLRQATPIAQPPVKNDDSQLMFNFDDSATAQNIYHKLKVIMEKIDALNVKVNALSEQVNKKKVRKNQEKE